MARQRPATGTRKTGKPAKPGAAKAATASAVKVMNTKGQTLRLNMDAWRQLRYLAFDNDATAHDLLLEAVNDLFRKYGKRPLA